MAHWEFEHSAESEADPETLWARYTRVDKWSEWSPKGVERSSLEGDFEVGAKGRSKAPHFPEGKFELIVVEPERRFVSQAKMPGATLAFEHMIEPSGEGTRITHRAALDGPLVFIWRPVVGRMIEKGMPNSVEGLAKLAVEDEKEAAEKERVDREREKEMEEIKREHQRKREQDDEDPDASEDQEAASG